MNNNSINRLYESVVRIEVNPIEFQWDAPFVKNPSGSGSGSGFVIDNRGHILTCFHVINQSVHIFVTFPYSGKDKIPAKIVAIYPEMDMAIIKINKTAERYLELGNSDSVKIGKEVLAIGYPLGQDKLKITKGIVSGLENGFIQTDAPINAGNSGGPLMYEGKVVGINTAKIMEVGTEGVGYANPIDIFNKIRTKMIPELVTDGKIIKVDQPSLGILTDKSSKQIMDFFDCDCPSGIQIIKIFDNSPLKKGDFPAKDGDILCSINGFSIDNNGECQVPWNREKVNYSEVFDRYSLSESKMKITYYTILKQELVDENGKVLEQKGGLFNLEKFNLQYLLQSVLDSNGPQTYYRFIGKMVEKQIEFVSAREIFKIWNYYPPYDPVKYVAFGGIVFMNLSMNHIMMQEFNHLFYNFLNKLDKSAVIITKILPSSIKIDGLLTEGDVIEQINGIQITNILEVEEALKKPINKINKNGDPECYITFKTGLGKFYAIKLKKVIKEDVELFQYFNYEPSEATKFYIKNYNNFSCLKTTKSNSNNSNNNFTIE